MQGDSAASKPKSECNSNSKYKFKFKYKHLIVQAKIFVVMFFSTSHNNLTTIILYGAVREK